MAHSREDWFPTAVWMFDHPAQEPLNDGLIQCIRAERDADPKGMAGRSSVLGWHSGDDLHRRPGLADLIPFLEASVAEVVAFLCWDLSKIAPMISNCWANINIPGSSNQVHNHPNSILSGVYYVAAPEKGGDLFFLDPRVPAIMHPLPLTKHNPWTFERVVYKPQVGRLLIFPSWLYHGVEPNLSEQDRVCVSFNVGVRWI